jgi:hypothetical protein
MKLKVLFLLVLSFGVATSAFADGYMEATMKQFYGSKDKFEKMLSLLKANNTEQGKLAAQEFKASIQADQDAAISPALRELDSPRSLLEKWEDGWKSYVDLRLDMQELIADYIGKKDYKDMLSKIENQYKVTSDKFKTVVEAFMEYGKKFRKICETCQ